MQGERPSVTSRDNNKPERDAGTNMVREENRSGGLGIITPRDFRVGVQKKSAKILTMEAKTVKTNKRTESGQKWLKSAKSCDYFEPL